MHHFPLSDNNHCLDAKCWYQSILVDHTPKMVSWMGVSRR
jgi:hypothetical protein